MKFIIEKLSKCTPRLGAIQELDRLPEFKLETPNAMLYTRSGSVPNITHEVLQMISPDKNNILQIPLSSTAQYISNLKDYTGTLSTFVGLSEYPSCLTIQDTCELAPHGHHQKNQIPLWTRAGKMYVDADSYFKIVKSFKPDMYFILSDNDTNSASATKRISKAVDNTTGFFNHFIENYLNDEELNKKAVFASISGGFDLTARKRCLKAYGNSKDCMNGFILDGLHNNGPEMEFLQFDEIKTIVSGIVDELPESKVRIVPGCWNPVTVIKLVTLGIDLFDTSYVHIVTERASALTFSLDPSVTNAIYEINLRNPIYAQDFNPLVENCECLTCRKHTRAYINHLYNVQELLGPILLTIHNLHHYFKLFKKIRQSIQENKISDLDSHISKQFEDFQKSFKPMKKEEIVQN